MAGGCSLGQYRRRTFPSSRKVLMYSTTPCQSSDTPKQHLWDVSWEALISCLLSIWAIPGGSDGKAYACNAGHPGSILGSGRPSGEGNGSPLQYSCLENSTDGGAWKATVRGIAKSRAWLRDFTFTFVNLPLSVNSTRACLRIYQGPSCPNENQHLYPQSSHNWRGQHMSTKMVGSSHSEQ